MALDSPDKILLLTEWFVPGFKAGGPIKSVYLLAENLSKQFEIYVLTTNKDYLEKEAYKDVVPDKWDKLNGKGYSTCYVSEMSVSRMLSSIRGTQPNVVYVNGLFSFYFSVLPVFLHLVGLTNTKLVIAPRGMLHDGAIQYKKTKKNIYLWLLRVLRLDQKVVFHATDQQEKLDILGYFPKADIRIVSNFIAPDESNQARIKKENGAARLIFVSRISPKKNLLFLIRLLLSVSGDIHLSIVGPIDDEDYWRVCQAKITELPQNVSVEYLGAKKPKELSIQLCAHHFLVLPTLGENFGHVITEALVQGIPVLTSDLTPWKDLKKKNIGWDVGLNDAGAWHQSIMDIVEMNQEEYTQMSHSARHFIDSHFNMDDIKNKYMKLFS